MTPLHQITVPAHDGIRPDEEPQVTQDVADSGARRAARKARSSGANLTRAPTPLPFENGDLVTQGENLDVLVPISHRQQPQCREGIRESEIGQAKEHDRSSCRTGSPSGIEACLQEKPCKAVTWTDGIIGRHTGQPLGTSSGTGQPKKLW
jgi:hypothetical protein